MKLYCIDVNVESNAYKLKLLLLFYYTHFVYVCTEKKNIVNMLKKTKISKIHLIRFKLLLLLCCSREYNVLCRFINFIIISV